MHLKLQHLASLVCLAGLAPFCAPTARVSPLPAPAAGPGAWRFQPPTDTFSPTAALDLRALNEQTAGETGFVRALPDGQFALGSGKPARFWAVDEYIQDEADFREAKHKLRWLAKRGVNMVRVHAMLMSKQPGSSVTDADQKQIDSIWKLVAAARAAGAYTTISPYWSVAVKLQPSWNVPGGANQSAAALLFWDPTLQKGYKEWWKALLLPRNPYDGLPLWRDPAVAILQLQNEDSMLFWTIQGVKGPQLQELETLYGQWLTRKYGSLGAANRAWGGETPPDGSFQAGMGDDFAQGRAGIYIVWYLTQPASGYTQKRLSDQLQFFVETMKSFNTRMIHYLRTSLGCKQLINPGNWRPADPALLMDDERYSYAPGDVMAINRYFDGEHVGPDNGWAIRPGDRFTNASALLDPVRLPTNVKRPVGYPFIIPETQWVAPSAYQAEGPLLTAAYESLDGIATSYFFADGDAPEWQQPFGAPVNGWQPPMAKWQIATPEQLGQFPAAALLYRMGYVQQGTVAVHEERSPDDLWRRRSPIIAEEGGFDPNRDAGDLPPGSAVKQGVNPLAFLVGPVEVKLGGDSAHSSTAQLSRYIGSAHKVVRSDTGELRLDYGKGVFALNAPKAQGACGFLSAAGPIRLADVTLRCGNQYASVVLVSLDGKPLASSGRMLLQVGAVARPTGWRTEPATWKSQDGKQTFTGRQVVSTGQNPWSVADTNLTVAMPRRLTSATLLDANFMPASTIPITSSRTGTTIRLPPDAMYVELR